MPSRRLNRLIIRTPDPAKGSTSTAKLQGRQTAVRAERPQAGSSSCGGLTAPRLTGRRGAIAGCAAAVRCSRWFGTRVASRTTRDSRGAVRATRSVARTTKLTCRGRCKSLMSRETRHAAPVRCSAWFGSSMTPIPGRVLISHLLQVSYQFVGRLQGGLSLDLVRVPALVHYRVPFL